MERDRTPINASSNSETSKVELRHYADLSYAFYRSYRFFFHSKQWLGQQFTPLGIGVFVIAVLTGLLGLWSVQSLCHQLFFLALALLVISRVSRQQIKLSCEIDRSLPIFGSVGEPLRYSIHIQNRTSIAQSGLQAIEVVKTPYLEFREFLKVYSPRLTSGELNRRIKTAIAKQTWAIASLTDIPNIKPRGKTEVTGRLTPLRRGRLILDAMTLKVSDPLGLSYQWVNCQQRQSVCILPQRYALPPMFSNRKQSDSRGEVLLSSRVGESMEFRSLRDYRPGDPTNKIHWKSWAKVGRPVVREQHDESTVRYGLLLDTFYPESQSDVFEEMVAIAISIVMQMQKEQALLDIVFACPEVRYITTGAGSQQKARALEILATLFPCQTHPFSDVIPLAQSRLSKVSSTVCVLTQWDNERQTFLERLAQSDIPIQVIVICEGQTSHEGLRYLSLSQTCTVYFVSLNQIQEDLLQL